MEENISQTPPKQDPPVAKKESWLKELINFALIAVFIVIPFRIFIAQPFIVSGDSMDPTFLNGQYLIVDQISYRLEAPSRDSVVIFRYPLDPSKFFIKRIIGLPGDTIKITNNKVFVNDEELAEPYLPTGTPTYIFTSNTWKLAPDQYFVLGDNRPHSSDSRIWGILPKKDIIGRPFLRLFPLNTIGIFPGDYSTNTGPKN